ncbi:MAG: ABC transporter permease [Actinobacteria bacterium]|nr:ABC transporter permease [Actinomycetota bacterium]
MWAIALKEFRQLRRDRRTVAMLFLFPFLFLVVFGYAASFDVKEVPTLVVGPGAPLVAAALPAELRVVATRPADGAAQARDALRRGEAVAAIVTPSQAGAAVQLYLDGTELFATQAALRALAKAQGIAARGGGDAPQAGAAPGGASVATAKVAVLFNPDLRTAVIMIPGLCGIILVFVGTVATALGVVRERQAGTMEQLAVMPFRPRDVFVGKIAPYMVIAALDMAIVVGAGMLLFNVPFRGSVAVFALGSALFLFVTLGIGVLISTVSQTQGQAIQLAMMTLLPQFLLSGLFFPLYAMPWGVRWIGYLLPLTYFIKVARGVMVRGAPIGALWAPLVVLAVMALVVSTASTLRFRRDLAPASGGDDVSEAAGGGDGVDGTLGTTGGTTHGTTGGTTGRTTTITTHAVAPASAEHTEGGS